MKRLSVFFAIIFVMLAAVLIFFYAKSGRRSESIRTTGIVEGIEVNISTKVPGRISEICCEEGDVVKAGNTVIELENDALLASVEDALAGVEKAKAEVRVSGSAIETSKANIASAAADIISAAADVEAVRAQTEEAKRQMDRLIALYKQEVISKQSLDAGITNYDTAVANYASSKARLTAAYSKRDAAVAELSMTESRLKSAKASLRQSEANLAYNRAKLADTTITSPISGTVVFKALEKGEMVTPGVAVLTIVDLDNLYVRVDIDETMIDNVALNSEAVIRTERIAGRVFKGKVTVIGRYAEFATQRDVTRGRQDIKTFRVKIAVKDSAGVLKPGMTVEVEIPKRIKNGSKEQGR